MQADAVESLPWRRLGDERAASFYGVVKEMVPYGEIVGD
jgi:hypothetical protein